MQKQVFTGLIYTEFYTPCQHFRNLVSSWEVGKTTCVKQVVNKTNIMCTLFMHSISSKISCKKDKIYISPGQNETLVSCYSTENLAWNRRYCDVVMTLAARIQTSFWRRRVFVGATLTMVVLITSARGRVGGDRRGEGGGARGWIPVYGSLWWLFRQVVEKQRARRDVVLIWHYSEFPAL